MRPAFRQFCCLIVLCLTVLITESTAKPVKPASAPGPADFSELDKLVTEELKAKNTPGAVIKCLQPQRCSRYVKFEGKEYVATKSGERKITFGEQNENELVFVPGKDGKIGFLFTELYGAKKIK